MFPDVGCREGDGSLEDGIEALLVILENIALGRKSDGLVVVFSEDVLNEAAAFSYLSSTLLLMFIGSGYTGRSKGSRQSGTNVHVHTANIYLHRF